MVKSNAILILKTFSDEEVKLFKDFLNSPFHNKNNKVIQLYNVLKKYHPEYKSEEISKENLFKELFGNVVYKESYIRNLFSDLNILAEKFLLNIHTAKNYIFEKFLIEELKNRDVGKVVENKISSFERKINLEESKDQEYYTNRVFIYTAKSFLRADKTLTENFRPDQISSNIKLFMLSLMENSFYLLIEEQRVQIKHNFGFLKHTLEYLRNHLDEFKDSPLLLIYYYLCQCFFDKDDEKYFLKTKDLFKKHFSSISKTDKSKIYSLMQTFCINKIDAGNISYNKELLNILLEMLKFNIVSHTEKDFINLNLYRNILLLCRMMNEIKILKKFISDYIHLVSPESRESISAYSYAQLNFLQGNFEKALEMCNKVNFNDLLISTNDNLFFKNDIKSLTLKCLYELSSFESAMSLIDAYKHFLKNSRIIKEDMRKKFMNFLNLVSSLINLKIEFDDFKLIEIKSKIFNSNEFSTNKWILEKINELERVNSIRN